MLTIGGPIHYRVSASQLQGSSEEVEIALCSHLQYEHPLGTFLELPKDKPWWLVSQAIPVTRAGVKGNKDLVCIGPPHA